ncbi:MAG: hypothetical protein QM535_06095 [Limnohabitans sp.]|nr:hypothetical protein [Limnohabitans sp.]
MKPLYDLQNEINRIYIAGSRFAINDPRLEKHVPIFKKLGEKAPVFNKIADDLTDLIHSDATQSATKLMNLGTLIYAILYTQGETIQEGKERIIQIPNLSLDTIATNVTYHQLRPIIQALTVSGSHRIEDIKEAFYSDLFKDFRLHSYVVQALGDKNNEVAQYAEDTLLPYIGKSILPLLRKQFAFEDFAINCRILRVLITLNDETLPQIVETIFKENLPKLQAEAVYYLVKDQANEAFVIQLCNDKNRLVREAALKVLAGSTWKSGLSQLNLFYTSLKTKTKAKLEPIISALSLLKSDYSEELFSTLEQSFEHIENAVDYKDIDKKIDLFSVEIEVLRYKDHLKTYAIIERFWANEFLLKLTDKKFFASKFPGYAEQDFQSINNSINYIHTKINRILCTLPEEKVIVFFDKNKAILNQEYIPTYFALLTQKPHDKQLIYTYFSKWYPKVIDSDLIIESYNYSTTLLLDDVDKKWSQLAMEIKKPSYEDILLSHYIEPKFSKDFNQRLTDYVVQKNRSYYNSESLYQLLLERDVPNKFDIILNDIKNYETYHNLAITDEIKAIFKTFPKNYASKFREIPSYRTSKKFYFTFDELLTIADELEQQ